MTQEIYSIKEAAKQVHVESHVLRYWEEELGLTIARNDQGHRYYTKDDVALLDRIRNWKGQGLQLKAIRLMLSEDGKLSVPQDVIKDAQAMMEKKKTADEKLLAVMEETQEAEDMLVSQDGMNKAVRLQLMLENLVSRAVQENSEKIMEELDQQVQRMEENAQARERQHWEREEEHYRKLDELLCQRGRRKDKRKKHSKN